MLDYGQCYVSVQDRLMYIPMHKNMSSAMRSVMTEQQWKFTNFMKDPMLDDELMEKLTVFCITREPWERWNSAMCQYWYSRDINDITKETLMQVKFDHHSDRQVDYVAGFDPNEKFLRFDMGDPGIAKLIGVDTIKKRNQSKYRDQKVFIQRRIDEVMDDELKQTVIDYYEADYEFINHGVLPK